jgi:DNA-binding protein YbaB
MFKNLKENLDKKKEDITNMSIKLKLAKDLIINGSKAIPLIKEKAEELFKYRQRVKMKDGLGSVVLNGKFECMEINIDPELFQNDPNKAQEIIQSAITKSNQAMLDYILEECKKLGKEVDPKLMDEISEQIEEEIDEHSSKS